MQHHEGSHANKALATQSALAPQAISISLDPEKRSDAVQTDLIKRSEGLIRFLPRRTYENYLVHAGAISAVLKEIDGKVEVEVPIIEGWIAGHRFDAKYYQGVARPKKDETDNWLRVVDAPRFLHDLIAEVTSNAHDYGSRKVQFGVALTKWLIAHDNDRLTEIVAHVVGLLASASINTAIRS